MNEFIIEILNLSSYISAVLIIFLGGLIVIALPIWLIALFMNWIYRQMKASYYFISFVRNRKKFIEWHKQNDPDVYTPKLKD